MSILVIGSIALDSVRTPFGSRNETLGGSATYFSIAASFYNKVRIVATVGEDFPSRYMNMFKTLGIDTSGVIVTKGKTFRWKGRYDQDLNTAHTIYTHLNVFKDFNPQVPEKLKNTDFVFLANIDPDLQRSVLEQMKKPKLVACDSMNYWIANKRSSLERLLPKIDILLLNDSEARLLSKTANLKKAARRILSYGPKALIIKRGEHGVIYFSRNSYFIAPAYLLETIRDPTGAGDTFAGGLMGYIASAPHIDESTVKKGIIYGSILASFTVEGFSVSRLLNIGRKDIAERYRHFTRMTRS